MMNAGPMGTTGTVQLFNWYFAPVVLSTPDAHPICANLDPLHFDFVRFAGPVNLRQTAPAPHSCVAHRARWCTTRRSMASAVVNLPPEHFDTDRTDGHPLAILTEGHFDSFYALRLNADLRDDFDFAFKESTDGGRMIVVADADFIRNNTRPVEGGIAPLPWDTPPEQKVI